MSDHLLPGADPAPQSTGGSVEDSAEPRFLAIGRITKPVVWSLYDMWVMAGSEHYGVDKKD